MKSDSLILHRQLGIINPEKVLKILDFHKPLWYMFVLQRRGGYGTDEFRRIVPRRKCGRKVRYLGRSYERLPPKWASGGVRRAYLA